MFTDNPFPNWNAFCDECGWDGWASDINSDLKNGKAKPVRKRPRAKVSKRNKLLDWREEKSWTEYHNNLDEKARKWWRSQGIPDNWQDHWKLGFMEEKHFKAEGEKRTSPAYTIPKFGLNWIPMNMDYRLIDYPDVGGKYRPEYGLSPFPFLSDPSSKNFFNRDILIVEGSKKAMVTYLKQSRFESIIGVPSCNSWAGAEQLVKTSSNVFIAFDPDAEIWANRLAREVDGKIISIASKIDDAFLFYGLEANKFDQLVEWAREPYLEGQYE